MAGTNAFNQDMFDLIFTNVDAPDIGDAAGLQNSATVGNMHISLHTADPGETGNQSTNEATYTSYARQAVVRSAAGWTTASADPATVTNDAAITFPQATGGSETITHVGIGFAVSGATTLYYHMGIDSPLAVSNGITPEFAINALNVTLD